MTNQELIEICYGFITGYKLLPSGKAANALAHVFAAAVRTAQGCYSLGVEDGRKL